MRELPKTTYYRRKQQGLCVACPKAKVQKADEGKTRCAACAVRQARRVLDARNKLEPEEPVTEITCRCSRCGEMGHRRGSRRCLQKSA